jgi:hypothetical protein
MIRKTPGVYERGPIAAPILGTQPGTAETYIFFLSVAISDYLIARSLPAKWRPYFQGAVIVSHGTTVAANCDLELCR